MSKPRTAPKSSTKPNSKPFPSDSGFGTDFRLFDDSNMKSSLHNSNDSGFEDVFGFTDIGGNNNHRNNNNNVNILGDFGMFDHFGNDLPPPQPVQSRQRIQSRSNNMFPSDFDQDSFPPFPPNNHQHQQHQQPSRFQSSQQHRQNDLTSGIGDSMQADMISSQEVLSRPMIQIETKLKLVEDEIIHLQQTIQAAISKRAKYLNLLHSVYSDKSLE